MSQHKQAMSQRIDTLLLSVAADYERAAVPMNREWLCEHAVSLDECGVLLNQLATIIKGYVNAPKHVQTAILISSAADDKAQAEMLTAAVERSRQTRQVIDNLGKLNKKPT